MEHILTILKHIYFTFSTYLAITLLSNAMKTEPAICTCYKEGTRMVHVQCERLPKYKMASIGFLFVHVLRFGNEFNEELCCGVVFTIFNNH